MPYILEVLKEERERLINQKKDYIAILTELPRVGGSIVRKTISGHIYHYFAYREGKKVKTEYIKKNDVDDFRKKIAERDRIRRIISGIDSDLDVIEKALNGETHDRTHR
ncbi:hypothetical protein [Selenomonas sp. KH1T6]|uniref:hypothetical protein n=1 Tax=Selenomonas sp. KH1T6 TaxID=3158784 RepID=UPI0008A7CC0D|nr:hypothetical protein SAMN05216583_14811 [Selenomonas ruminantium]